MIYKVFGPPGTGKTFELIQRAKQYIDNGVSLNEIGYFAFTKKAAKEAKERMPFEKKKIKILSNITFISISYVGS